MNQYVLLYQLAGDSGWRRIHLARPRFSIGRSGENDLVLDDDRVSPRHAGILIDARGVWIRDENASSGVFIQGQRIQPGTWVLLKPDADFTIGPASLRIQAGSTPVPTPSGRRPGEKKKTSLSPWVCLAGVVVALAFCLCLGGGGLVAYFYLPGRLPAVSSVPASPSAPPAPPTIVDTLSGTAGGPALQDDHGVSLDVPAAQVDNGQTVNLARLTLSSGMQSEVEKYYTVDGMAYSAVLPPGEGSSGQVTLSLPAPSPNSRLAVLVDDRMLGLLDTPIQGGAFHISTSLALSTTDPLYGDPATSAARPPNHFLVVTPKVASLINPDKPAFSLLGDMAGSLPLLSLQADAQGDWCVTERFTTNRCWRNAARTVYIFWQDDYPPSMQSTAVVGVKNAADLVAGIMSDYASKGFIGAKISPNNPVDVVISKAGGDPYYSAKTGNVYLPWNDIANLGDTQSYCDISHELFHLVQAAAYHMSADALSNPKLWWLEVSAENGAFLLNPACIDNDLTQYGEKMVGSGLLGFQAAPFQFAGEETARYVQSQQLYLSMCTGETLCALSMEDWINAINNGTFPLEDIARIDYEQNAKDLGRYLLGAAPENSRTDAAIPPSTVSGHGFGDHLSLAPFIGGISTGGQAGKTTDWSYGPTKQFTEVNARQVQVHAAVSKGSVYPIVVSNGGSALNQALDLPAFLEIRPGPAFWMKEDNNDPVFYPAGTGLKLGAISSALGTGQARIVAVAPDGDLTFNAVMSLVNLSGAWTGQFLSPQVTDENCGTQTLGSNYASQTSQDVFLQLISGKGNFNQNSGTSEDIDLTWVPDNPADFQPAAVSATVSVQKDRVVLHYSYNIPQPSSTTDLFSRWLGENHFISSQTHASPHWGLALFILPGLGAVLGLRYRKRRRVGLRLSALSLAMLALCLLLLNGCSGKAWGTIDGTYTFHKLEYVGEESPVQSASLAVPKNVTWLLSDGQMELDVNLTIDMSFLDPNSVPGTIVPCSFKITSDSATGTSGPAGSVEAPSTK